VQDSAISVEQLPQLALVKLDWPRHSRCDSHHRISLLMARGIASAHVPSIPASPALATQFEARTHIAFLKRHPYLTVDHMVRDNATAKQQAFARVHLMAGALLYCSAHSVSPAK
jgi:hypothetical protein